MLHKGIVTIANHRKGRVTIMENTKYKVAGYLRLSKEDGDKEESDSIVSQKSIIENKIKELGKEFELYDLYIDDGYTGLNTDRPSFKKMITDIENGMVKDVYAFEPQKNASITFTLYDNGMYAFAWPEQGVKEFGTWSYEGGAFAVTDPLGQQTAATISGDTISFTYNYSLTSQLNQPYKGSVSALEAAVENMTGGEQ